CSRNALFGLVCPKTTDPSPLSPLMYEPAGSGSGWIPAARVQRNCPDVDGPATVVPSALRAYELFPGPSAKNCPAAPDAHPIAAPTAAAARSTVTPSACCVMILSPMPPRSSMSVSAPRLRPPALRMPHAIRIPLLHHPPARP